ncbi:MAG: transposase [Hyphomonas sp.]|nr:integrase core domain-containing protein [Hyphomonas sp.]MCB9970024.1 transposase [Hyphomonas sp.]
MVPFDGGRPVRLKESRTGYNESRPHSALGNLTPIAFAALVKKARKVS